jgi:8-oxo-dGTP pyrophosphatase MutT (NUDIX family)
VIVRDRDGLLLMFEGVDPTTPEVRFWFTPGGGLDAGETFEEAAARELREEAGYELRVLGGVVHEDEVEFDFEGVTYRQRQRFFAVAVPVAGPTAALDRGGWTDVERRSITGYRWWSLDELETTSESIYPPDLAGIVGSITDWGAADPA